jgi:hypothetical protein
MINQVIKRKEKALSHWLPNHKGTRQDKAQAKAPAIAYI